MKKRFVNLAKQAQAWLGRTVKQEQIQIPLNHAQTIFPPLTELHPNLISQGAAMMSPPFKMRRFDRRAWQARRCLNSSGVLPLWNVARSRFFPSSINPVQKETHPPLPSMPNAQSVLAWQTKDSMPITNIALVCLLKYLYTI